MAGRAADGIYDGGAVALWIERPNLVLTQVRSSHYTVEQARTFVHKIMPRARNTLATERLVWVSDSRAITSYQTGSRGVLTEWGVHHKRELERIIIIASPNQKITLMGLHVARVAATVAGIRMTVLTSLEDLRDEGITWPGEEPMPFDDAR